MVTKWIIPCSVCGKPVTRFIYCSGGCKVKGYRGKQKKNILEKELPKVTSVLPKVTDMLPKVTAEPLVEKKGHWEFSQMLNRKVWKKD